MMEAFIKRSALNKSLLSFGPFSACLISVLFANAATAQERAAGELRSVPGSSPSDIGDVNSGSPDQIAEIIVTAEKREQRLSDVGVTISAFSGSRLSDAGVTDILDLSKITPGLNTATTYGGYPVFSLRGVNFNAAQLSAPPAVSVYLDEVPLPYSAMTSGILFDVERVEVLKGPQGTLFGQNATGGSINVIAAKPTRQLLAGIKAEVNNFGQAMAEGYLSGPITNNLLLRISATTTQFGAWQKGYFLNSQKNGDQNKGAARLLLNWRPADRLKISVNLNGFYDRGEVRQAQFLAANTPLAAPAIKAYPVARTARGADIDPGFDTRANTYQYQGSLRVDYGLSGSSTLTSITSYTDHHFEQPRNADGTALVQTQTIFVGDIKSFYQELRLTGVDLGGRLNYIAGANYQRDRILDDSRYDFSSLFSGLPGGSQLDNPFLMRNKALGFFGNIDFEIAPHLSVTGGIRYTMTRQASSGCTRDRGNGVVVPVFAGLSDFLRSTVGLPPSGAFVPGGCVTVDNVARGTSLTPTFLPLEFDRSQKENNTSWRVGLNYKLERGGLIYGLVSRGYKAGLYPALITLLASQNNPVGQEELTAFEVGLKLSFFDRAVLFNTSAFYYDYKDKQFYTYVPILPIGIAPTLVNIPKSKVKGIDADITAMPVRGLTVRAGVTYIDTEVGRFSGFDFGGQVVEFGGKEFNFASPLSATFDAEYEAPITDKLDGYVGGGLLYNSRTFADLGESDLARLPAYTILDARIGLKFATGLRLGLFVRNTTNKFYITSIGPGSDAFVRFAGNPRTYGMSMSMKF